MCGKGSVVEKQIQILRARNEPGGVWFVEKADDREEDGTDVLGGVPALARQLAALGVVHGRVQDGDAQVAVLHKH